MEAAQLALFLFAACAFTALLEHPDSPVHRAVGSAVVRRAFMGLAMGGTAVTLIYSPWGQRSGAHLNPAVTFAYWSLGKVAGPDAFFYAGAHFAGAFAGVQVAAWLLGLRVSHHAVNYAATLPSAFGIPAAFAAETFISGLLFFVVLTVSNHRRLAPFTPWFAGGLVALYITVEAPLSGMSMNPARTLGSALFARQFSGLWLYFLAPTLGMLAAAWGYRLWRGGHQVFCAKLHHHNQLRCIFRCNQGELYVQP
jgi:aquaporin Z